MKKLKVIPIILFCFVVTINAQTPDWVKNMGKSAQFPDIKYLTGFGMAKLDKEEDRASCVQLAIDRARKNIIERIRVQIQSIGHSESKETNEGVGSYYTSVVQTNSSLELDGLQTESYYDKSDAVAYGFAYINREQVIDMYRKKAEVLQNEIRTRFSNAKHLEETQQQVQALNEYLGCYPVLRKIEEISAIISAAETNVTKAFDELEVSASKETVSTNDIQQSIERLINRPVATFDEVAWKVVYMLKNQVDISDKTIMVVPITYQDTKLGSSFSRYFKQTIEGQGVAQAKWSIVQQSKDFKPKTQDLVREYAQVNGAEYVLNGTYWETPSGLKLLIGVRHVSDAKLVASVEMIVPNSVIQASNVTIKPENFKDAFSEQKEFLKDEVIDGGLNLEVWTNKGSDNVLYTKGEKMTVSLRVNMPCYIRFIYHLADGKRVLLLDSHYIDESKVNKVYTIPQEFICDAPFGGEFLQVFACNEPFETLDTIRRDGYDILKEDLNKILSSTRGMKLVNPKLLQVESRIAVTTMDVDK